MLINIDNLRYEARWFDYQDGVRLKIRPYPASMSNVIIRAGKGVVLEGEESLKMFVYCLIDWDGVVDANGKPLPCTDEIKRIIYDFQVGGLPQYTIMKVRELETVKEADEKN